MTLTNVKTTGLTSDANTGSIVYYTTKSATSIIIDGGIYDGGSLTDSG